MSEDVDEDKESARQDATVPLVPAAPVVRSEELFAGRRVLLIEHAGQQYRLLITRNDRRILQK